MTTHVSTEVRQHADRKDRRRRTRKAQGWLLAMVAGVAFWLIAVRAFLVAMEAIG